MQPIQTKTFINGTVVSKKMTESTKDNQDFGILKSASFKVIEGKKYKGQDAYSTFRTGEKGNFLLNLPPGEYAIVEDDRPETFNPPPKSERDQWDIKCLKKRWATPLITLKIEISEPVSVSIKILQYSKESDPCRLK